MLENLNTIIFVAGLGLACAGLWGWFSWHVAATFVGAVLMTLAVYPYVTRFGLMFMDRRKGR